MQADFLILLREISEGRWKFSGHAATVFIFSGLVAFVVTFVGPESAFRDNILYCIPLWFGIGMLSAFVLGQRVYISAGLSFDTKPEDYVGRLIVTAFWTGCYVYGMFKVFGGMQFF